MRRIKAGLPIPGQKSKSKIVIVDRRTRRCDATHFVCCHDPTRQTGHVVKVAVVPELRIEILTTAYVHIAEPPMHWPTCHMAVALSGFSLKSCNRYRQLLKLCFGSL